jgi:MazG family protein
MSKLEKLLEVMNRLRDPNGGCEWDRQQTFSSIAPYTIEEAYEVADAIARNNMPDLRDELGDLLFQVVFHAYMAEEAGEFNFSDVVAGLTDKLIRRHPHVFGNELERSAGQQKGSWEAIKADERVNNADTSALADVPIALPALKRAEKIGGRVSRVGFDWPNREGVRAKIHEELEELEEAVGTRSAAQIEEEFGDLLFAVVNMARHLEVDPENALTAANYKFERRFRDMESAITGAGGQLKALSLESLDKEWRAAKTRVG